MKVDGACSLCVVLRLCTLLYALRGLVSQYLSMFNTLKSNYGLLHAGEAHMLQLHEPPRRFFHSSNN